MTPFRTPTSKRFPPATPRSHGGAAMEHPVEVVARVRNLTTGASALEVPGGTTVRVCGDAGGCRDFSLDGVSLSEEEDLESFYRRFVRSRVDGVRVAGAKCTVMVYGPTASGKSRTMFGCAKQPGIVYHALRDLLDDDGGGGGCGEGGAQGLFLQVTMLEIYNEEIYDLLEERSGANTPKVLNFHTLSIRDQCCYLCCYVRMTMWMMQVECMLSVKFILHLCACLF